MKQILMAFAATILLTTATGNANAQSAFGNASINGSMYFYDSTTNPPTAAFSTSDMSNINVRAVKNFQKAFSNVNANWFKASDGGYIAKFTNGPVKTLVAFNAKGVLHHSIFYYDEKQLPRDVRTAVKSTYWDYSIAGVSEVHVDGQVIYMVLIQDETTIKMIRVCDGELEEVNNLNSK